MQLKLRLIPNLRYYTDKQDLPGWMSRLHPAAADALVEVEKHFGGLWYTDVWRSAEMSLNARASKAGVQRPAYSGHNFGFSIDLDIDRILKAKKITYAELLAGLAKFDWLCHRRDGASGRLESWHFNHLPDNEIRVAAKEAGSWAGPVELRIKSIYGHQLELNVKQVQEELKQMRFYKGSVDGLIGPLSLQAIKAFQRAWKLPETGEADKMTQRTLAFVGADITLC